MPIKFSVVALLAANFVPLIGVVFLDWDIVFVLALFWIENLIIGGFNVVKILAVSAHAKMFKGLYLAVFFTLHYGLFCAGHGKLLAHLLNINLSPEYLVDGPLALFSYCVELLGYFIDTYSPVILLGISGLLLSHTVSFVEHFILRGGILKQTPRKLMGKPYKQILVMHLGLVVGALAVQKLGSSVWLLAVIVVVKMMVDLQQHKRRHTPEPIAQI